MRNLIRLTFVALALLPVAVSGQTALGVKAGANLAELSGAPGSEGITGVLAGVYFGFGLTDQLAVQLEANYVTRGGEGVPIGANDLSGTGGSRVDISALDFPVLLRAGYPGERFLPSAFAGGFMSVLLSCQLTPPTGDAGDCDSPTRAAWFSPRSTDFGFVFGGGLDMILGSSSVFVEARYTLGLLSIQAGDEGFDVRNNGLVLSGGFAFPTSR